MTGGFLFGRMVGDMSKPTPVMSGLERAWAAAEKVKQQLKQVVVALNHAGFPYAVIGGNAVAEWVKQLDDGADRCTRDVDILIRRSDEHQVKALLDQMCLVGHARRRGDAFLRGDARLPRNTVYLLFECEKFQPVDDFALPPLSRRVELNGMMIMGLHELVEMKLTAFRTIDRVHIRDLMDVGQIDATWPARFPPKLATRLQEVLDDPQG
jgi:hypothetical protein